MSNEGVPIDTVEQRLAKLERKIYNYEEIDKQLKCLDSLISIQSRLQSAVTGREKITSVFSKLDEFEKYLSPEFCESMSLTESSKLNLVLLEEDRIRNVVDALQTIKDHQQYLDSEHIRSAPTLYNKLCHLSQIESEFEGQVSDLSDETRTLISSYDNLITSVSKEFILWDSIITKLEEEKATGKKQKL